MTSLEPQKLDLVGSRGIADKGPVMELSIVKIPSIHLALSPEVSIFQHHLQGDASILLSVLVTDGYYTGFKRR